jgi:hypothetical protein
MVSSVLAQAILNNDGPDLVGSFRKGQEISRQSKVKELSGQALKGNEGALEELSGLDPEIAYGLGETLRARSAKDINDFIRDARIGLDQLKNGDVQGAIAFGYQRRDSIRQRGGDTTQTNNYISLLESGDIESAMQGLQGLVGSIDEAKGVVVGGRVVDPATGKVIFEDKEGINRDREVQDAELEIKKGGLQLKQQELEQKLNKLPDAPELKDIRPIANDVTNMLKDTVAIKNSAARLERVGKTKTATDQLAAVFVFMKTLDPTSVVREGEQDQARSTGGISDQMLSFVKQIKGEGGLPEVAFNNMIATAKRLANQAIDDSTVQVDKFLTPFGDVIPAKFVKGTRARIPTKFEGVDPVLEQKSGEGAQPPANAQQKQGGKIMVDGKGNRALVFQDGTFEELP